MDIIEKLEKAGLTGRGGAAFPSHIKWKAVASEVADQKYVIANGSEGEPHVYKDGFIVKNHPEELIEGVRLAMEAIGGNAKGYIYLRKDYFDEFQKMLEEKIGDLPIIVYREPGGYLCGEETTLLESIEGNRFEPRFKPPYPTQKGLFGKPTLVNNIETFYWVSKIAKDEYKNERFYSVDGAVENSGVFVFPCDWTIEEVLKETNNLPTEKFFVQAGGGASGVVLADEECKSSVMTGTGSITVYLWDKTNAIDLMKEWAEFFHKENCGKCVPCREGVHRLLEMLQKDKVDESLMQDLFLVMKETSFCPLGKSVPTPFEGLLTKIWTKK
jgi:NADH:ubiquinone oxidoreductase subunit F (NADH-binding)